jgi:ribonuclease HI
VTRATLVESAISQIVEQSLKSGVQSLAIPRFEPHSGMTWLEIKKCIYSSFARVPDLRLTIGPQLGGDDPSFKRVTIFTDGGYDPTNDVGGYGVVLRFGDTCRELSQGFSQTTSDRMELMAAVTGLEALKESCHVRLYSDSRYVVNSVNEGRLFRFQLSSDRQQSNSDLWSRFHDAYMRHDTEITWVKAHAGLADNERCDQLATLALRGDNLSVDVGCQPRVAGKGKKKTKTTPRQAVPRQAAPRQAAPRQAAPRQAVPKQAAPKQAAPKQAAPKQAAPKQPAAAAPVGKFPKPKVPGDPCRKCGEPLVRRTPKKRNTTSAYYYEWYLYCDSCKRLYHVDEAKVFRNSES